MFFKKKNKEGADELPPPADSVSEDAPLGLPPISEGDERGEGSKDNSEETGLTDMGDSDVKEGGANTSGGTVSDQVGNAGLGQLIADVERMKAQMLALSESRKVNNERFSRISEQIGELRSGLTEHEKEMKMIEIKAVKAADLVSSVQPEKLMIEIKRQDTKIEALKSRIESNQLINEQIREELKEIRRKISLFRGVEEILNLNEEVKKELRNIQKVKAQTERHADKVETIFVEVEKNFAEFKKFKDLVENLNSQFKDVMKEMDKMRTKFNTFASRDEFNSLSKDINDKLSKLDEFVKSVENSRHIINSIADKVTVIESNQKEIQEMHDNMHKNFVRIAKWISYFKNKHE